MIAFLFLTSCDRPNLNSRPWEELAVTYCVGKPPIVQKKHIVITDPVVLQKLREKMDSREMSGLWSGGGMTTNKLDLKMKGKQRWEMYFLEATFITMHDPDARKRSFHFHLSRDFHDVLREYIKVMTGDDAHFFYSRQVSFR